MIRLGAMIRTAALLAGVLAVSALDGGAAAQQPKRGGTLNMVVLPEPPNLMAALDTSIPVQSVSAKIHNGLLNYDKDFNPQPELATQWEVAADGLSITFKLRPGVKWHDGKDFTAADVKFTLEKVIKELHPRGRATFANLDRVDTPDALTAILRLKTPTPYLIRLFASAETPIVPQHVYDGTDIRANPKNNAPIGTGPFRFVEWRKGSHIIFERFPDYWDKGKPYLDKIVFRVIPDAGARAVGFESGELDVGGPFPVPLNEMKRISELKTLAITTDGYTPFSSMAYLDFNLADPILKDVRVRRAIAHAIDKQMIVDIAYFGYATPATGPISQKLADVYTADVPKYAFDPRMAERLLDEAGYPRKQGGVRFALTLDPVPFADRFRHAAEYMKQALAQVGIQVDLRSSDAPTYLRRVYTQREHQMIFYGIYNMMDPTVGVQRMYWSQAFKPGLVFANASGYSNPAADAMWEQAQVETDPAKRKQLFIDLQKLLMTDLPNLPILNEELATIYNRRVHNMFAGLMGMYDTFADVYLDPQ